MGASRYIGRVGGLAIALGVGTAIVTGQGVATAVADDGSTNAPSTNTSGSSDKTDKPAVKIKKAIASVASDVSDTVAKHRADASTPNSSLATSIMGRVNANQVKKSNTDRPSLADRVAAATNVSASSVVVDKPAPSKRVLDFLSSPQATAGRSVAAATPTASSLLSNVQSTVLNAPAPARVSALLTNVVDDVLAPFSGNGPTTPVGSLSDILLLAGTRRETAVQTLLVTPPFSIGVGTNEVVSGCVVAGCVVGTADGLKYTLIGDPTNGGKVAVSTTDGSFTFLPFKNENGTQPDEEQFKVLVATVTPLDTILTGLPLVGSKIFAPAIVTLQQVPVVSTVLAPLIGTAYVQTVSAEFTGADALEGPFAYTTFVTSSVDGTQISTNFFPGLGEAAGPDDTYPTILYGPGLASAGATNPNDPTVFALREDGYNVVTWDPRGEFASGGTLQLDSPAFEGQDVKSIITYVAAQSGVWDDAAPEGSTPGDPRIGMVGVSYGGGIQLVTASIDPRVDAIAPGWSWNTLPASLYPSQDFKTAYSALLLLGLVTTGARINTQIYGGIITGALLGVLTPSQIALLQNSGPGAQVSAITAPTLIISGTVDVLFPLAQSIVNAGLLSNPAFVGDPTAITKVIWFCGGHGSCLPGQGDPAADQAWVQQETLDWMDTYVKDDSTVAPETTFEWTDENGTIWSSDYLPSDPAFYTGGGSIVASGLGHLLPIVPILGGSGPQNEVPLPYSLGDAAIAKNAVNIAIPNPVPSGGDPVNVVGAPTVTLNYSGIGTSRFVYGQIVDKTTGLVVGNIVTPIPVTLNGKDQTTTVDLNDIAYTVYGPGDPNYDPSDLELQITTTATPYLNLTQFGFINIKSVAVSLPTTVNAASAVMV